LEFPDDVNESSVGCGDYAGPIMGVGSDEDTTGFALYFYSNSIVRESNLEIRAF
jgi:hypothetical protein